MDTKKLAMGAVFAGAGALAFRSFSPTQMHDKCLAMCAPGGGEAESEEPDTPAKHRCSPQAMRDRAATA